MEPVLEIKNLSHVYGVDTPFEHVALDNVSLSVGRGEFVGLIGHTGSGKSTLIQHMNGLLKPMSGQVLFEGQDVWQDAKLTRRLRFHVGLVFQYPEYQLFEETVFQDIAFGPKNMGLSEQEIRARVLRAAGFVGITDKELEKSPFDLSGGQKRRAAIAGVIAMEPDVLILDEPTAGLDPAGRESILENIRAYQAAGRVGDHGQPLDGGDCMQCRPASGHERLASGHGRDAAGGFCAPLGAGPDGTCCSEGDADSAAAARARRGRSGVRLYGGAGGKAAVAACEGR